MTQGIEVTLMNTAVEQQREGRLTAITKGTLEAVPLSKFILMQPWWDSCGPAGHLAYSGLKHNVEQMNEGVECAER